MKWVNIIISVLLPRSPHRVRRPNPRKPVKHQHFAGQGKQQRQGKRIAQIDPVILQVYDIEPVLVAGMGVDQIGDSNDQRGNAGSGGKAPQGQHQLF